MNKEQMYRDLEHIADIVGIKLAPLEVMLSVYPDQLMGMEFDEEEKGAPNAHQKYSHKFKDALIKAFRSHDWLVYSDIYGHD